MAREPTSRGGERKRGQPQAGLQGQRPRKSTGRRARPADNPPNWKEELGDVRPLKGREKLQAPPKPARGASRRRAKSGAGPVRFEVERRGEKLEGRAPGIDRERLRRLRRGQVAAEESVDLHGLDAAAAQQALRDTLLAAHRSGIRCVLVIHGRGLHSAEGAVLREALVDWLAAAPLGPLVMAFASATPEHGGPGATYVLLRRDR